MPPPTSYDAHQTSRNRKGSGRDGVGLWLGAHHPDARNCTQKDRVGRIVFDFPSQPVHRDAHDVCRVRIVIPQTVRNRVFVGTTTPGVPSGT